MLSARLGPRTSTCTLAANSPRCGEAGLLYVWQARAGPSMPGGVSPPACLEQKPGAPLRLVDPHLDQAGGSDVPMLIAYVVRLAQAAHKCLVVLAQFRQHVRGLDVVRIVVQDSLRTRNMPD